MTAPETNSLKRFLPVTSLHQNHQCFKTSVKHTRAKDVVRGSVKGTGSTANMAPENKQTKKNQSHSSERNGRSINKQLNKMIKAQSEQAVLAELSGMLGQKKSWMCEMTKISFFNTPLRIKDGASIKKKKHPKKETITKCSQDFLANSADQ